MSVSYGDVFLRENDAETVLPRQWLSDQVVALFFEYMRRERFAGILGGGEQGGVVLIDPSISFLLSNCDVKTCKSVLESTQIYSADFAILPVNDNQAVDVAYGGSHWSLLFCRLRKQDFIAYDSLYDHNCLHAKTLAQNLAIALEFQGSTAKIISADCPHQLNAHDCGIYMLAFVEELLEQIHNTGNSPIEWDETTGWPRTSSQKRVETCAGQMRRRLQNLLAELRK